MLAVSNNLKEEFAAVATNFNVRPILTARVRGRKCNRELDSGDFRKFFNFDSLSSAFCSKLGPSEEIELLGGLQKILKHDSSILTLSESIGV